MDDWANLFARWLLWILADEEVVVVVVVLFVDEIPMDLVVAGDTVEVIVELDIVDVEWWFKEWADDCPMNNGGMELGKRAIAATFSILSRLDPKPVLEII